MSFCKVPVYVNISSCTLIVQCYDQGSNKTNKQKLKDTLDPSSRNATIVVQMQSSTKMVVRRF